MNCMRTVHIESGNLHRSGTDGLDTVSFFAALSGMLAVEMDNIVYFCILRIHDIAHLLPSMS